MGKKTTLDSGIAVVYDVDGIEIEYFGYVDSIVPLNFDNFQTVLFECKFWKSVIRQHMPNATVLVDECGLTCIRTSTILRWLRWNNEPFIFPKDISQVFYIDDQINQRWKLVIRVEP